ncbi:MAG: hypothetical protein U1F57_05825 [bacterium]
MFIQLEMEGYLRLFLLFFIMMAVPRVWVGGDEKAPGYRAGANGSYGCGTRPGLRKQIPS